MNSEAKFSCCFCDKYFRQRQSMYRHVRGIHNREPLDVKHSNIICPERTCKSSFFYREQLRSHIIDAHNVSLEVEEKAFPTYEEFKLWKQNIEDELKCSYIKKQSARNLTANQKKFYFICHRSGVFTSTTTGKRKMKSIGSRKINGYCPSSIEVLVRDEGVYVEFWKTHFGHSCDIKHLLVSEEEKIELADKIEKGVPFQQILDDVRNSVNPTQMKRIHLLTRKDLHNIAHQYRISHNETLHKKDAVSVSLWVQIEESLCPNELSATNAVLNEKWCIIKQIINKKLSNQEDIKMNEQAFLAETFDNIINFYTESTDDTSFESVLAAK